MTSGVRLAWLRAQEQAQRAARDTPVPAPEDGEPPGRDWDTGTPEYQQRKARADEAKADAERMRDPERGHWSSDVSGPVGVTRYS
jgi:hypothetical protein